VHHVIAAGMVPQRPGSRYVVGVGVGVEDVSQPDSLALQQLKILLHVFEHRVDESNIARTLRTDEICPAEARV
jgi:hypothetical protein